jgi:hypothetical protein
VEDLAYELDLEPWSELGKFWDMTPREFEKSYIGYLARWDRQWQQTAYISSYIIAVNSKKGKAPKIQKLLPRWPFAEHFKKFRR